MAGLEGEDCAESIGLAGVVLDWLSSTGESTGNCLVWEVVAKFVTKGGTPRRGWSSLF